MTPGPTSLAWADRTATAQAKRLYKQTLPLLVKYVYCVDEATGETLWECLPLPKPTVKVCWGTPPGGPDVPCD